ncbi:hypothetical protein C8R44DRAFT_817950 [Mycena epipterygia]|nr:hypothetical protein C8R44DRAFT_817950 [Mycena epipterygia]
MTLALASSALQKQRGCFRRRGASAGEGARTRGAFSRCGAGIHRPLYQHHPLLASWPSARLLLHPHQSPPKSPWHRVRVPPRHDKVGTRMMSLPSRPPPRGQRDGDYSGNTRRRSRRSTSSAWSRAPLVARPRERVGPTTRTAIAGPNHDERGVHICEDRGVQSPDRGGCRVQIAAGAALVEVDGEERGRGERASRVPDLALER